LVAVSDFKKPFEFFESLGKKLLVKGPNSERVEWPRNLELGPPLKLGTRGVALELGLSRVQS
jgi:hypothetical protein